MQKNSLAKVIYLSEVFAWHNAGKILRDILLAVAMVTVSIIVDLLGEGMLVQVAWIKAISLGTISLLASVVVSAIGETWISLKISRHSAVCLIFIMLLIMILEVGLLVFTIKKTEPLFAVKLWHIISYIAMLALIMVASFVRMGFLNLRGLKPLGPSR
ncbi:MAG: hypothetical protein LBT20_00440 [Clostridiales bacterium]|jgi:hypothetical protein|nr:hypothetical protein [Clostridiales bacterium]